MSRWERPQCGWEGVWVPRIDIVPTIGYIVAKMCANPAAAVTSLPVTAVTTINRRQTNEQAGREGT